MRTLRHSFESILRAVAAVIAVYSAGGAQAEASGMTVVTNGIMAVDTRQKLDWDTGEGKRHERECMDAFVKGAPARVTFHVVDTEGDPVSNALVQANFVFYGPNEYIKGMTDSRGLFVAEGKLSDKIIYSVRKEGYYNSSGNFLFWKKGYRCLENGRWLPWNPTLVVTLKQQRKKTKVYKKWYLDYYLPSDTDVGFDCAKADLVKPYGKGEVADLLFRSTVWQGASPEQPMTNILVVSCGPGGGLMRRPKDLFSNFQYLHEAPAEGYLESLTFRKERTGYRLIMEDVLPQEDYLIFRTRAARAPGGGPAEVCYGVIESLETDRAPSQEGMGWILISYAFNPEPGDRSLESNANYFHDAYSK